MVAFIIISIFSMFPRRLHSRLNHLPNNLTDSPTIILCLTLCESFLTHSNRECQAALEVLLVSPLFDCRCKRVMKKEPQCLQIFWSIHMGRAEDEDMDDLSPYEPVAPNWHPDTSRLKDCNPCLDAAKACNLNGSCKRQRSSYINVCSKGDFNPRESCSRKRCHKALRSFLDRVPSEFSHRLLFCPCQTEGCAERRRQTIVPDCSYKDKEKSNCIQLRKVCQQDSLCRSRLADYMVNCKMTPDTASTCPNQDNHQACLASYARLIGTDLTPNYVDSSFSNWTVSPWCTCKGSGNQEEECQIFLRHFTNNTCLSKPSQLMHSLKCSSLTSVHTTSVDITCSSRPCCRPQPCTLMFWQHVFQETTRSTLMLPEQVFE
uniref:GDNF/GAS1 domain-containing protein n=1 Tax=Amphilophus citrinellus TaxID=61819 RepID=A0A3Q0RMB5_AMPCI